LLRREEAIAAVFGREFLAKGKIQVLKSRYSFSQLKSWHDRQRMVTLAIPGVILTSIRESKNRLRIGVKDQAVIHRVEQELAELGIPREAVEIEVVKPVKFFDTLQDTRRPLIAGQQISRDGGGKCTLGFLAVREGQAGFVTAAHCTGSQGGVGGMVFHQVVNLPDGTNRVGVESVDPQLFTWPMKPCPLGRICRFSDSAFIRRDGGTDQSIPLASADFGYIADTNLNDLTIVSKFRIRGIDLFCPAAAQAQNLVTRLIITPGDDTSSSPIPLTEG